jgi:cobalt-zinc-cadmium efflux system outer membrane protein
LNGTSSKASVKQSNAIYASQEFVTANKLGLATQAASEELKRYQWDYEAQRMRVINDLKIRFYEVLGAQESVRLHRELVEIAEHNLDIAKTLLETKFVSQGEVLQAEIQRDAVEVFLFEANMRFEAGWEQLIAMAGLNSMKPVPLVGNLNENLPELDSNTCWQNLISNSPQIKAAEAELSHGLITINENRALGVPNFTVQTVVEYDQATQSTNASTLFALPLPLHNWNQGNTDKAIADVVADRADICRIYRVLQDSHTLSFQKYRTRLKECQSLKDVIIPKSKRALDLTQIAFENRQTSVSPVLAAQQSYFRSRIAYIDALTELHKTVVEIEGLQLTGGLNPAAIGSAIQSAPGGGGVQRQRALLNQLQENNTRTLMNAAQITQ